MRFTGVSRTVKQWIHIEHLRDACRLYSNALNRLILARSVSIHAAARTRCVLLHRLRRLYVNDRLCRHQSPQIARGLQAALETLPRL